MFKYSKLILTGIAGIGGGIYLDRSFLNHFKDVDEIKKSTENGMNEVESFSNAIFKVFKSYIIIISYYIVVFTFI